MNYITVAENIFNWLSSFQIIERVVPAERKGETLTFQLNHPTEGIISVTEPIPEEPYFRSHGIGFKLNASGSEPVTLEVYDFGGIFDPIDQSIPGDHYATTHFALLGALLYQKNQDPEILKKIKMAMEFHIHTYRDAYYFGEWGYHWDFQNYAFLETFQLLKNNLSEEETRICETVIKESKENVNNPLTNWAAMRGYSAALRYGQFHNFMDKVKKWWWIQKVKQSFQRDGCSDDYRNLSRSIQYHVFTLALLHRIYLIDPNRKLKSMILKGVEYFIRFIDPEGCFNYVGRGQEQIFGYAAAIYILEAAILLDNKNGDHYEKQVLRIWSCLVSWARRCV